jgi:hypothetical protein
MEAFQTIVLNSASKELKRVNLSEEVMVRRLLKLPI